MKRNYLLFLFSFVTIAKATDEPPEALLTKGNQFLSQNNQENAQLCFIKAWQKGNFKTRWQAYQGLGKIVFPDESSVHPDKRKYLPISDKEKKAYLLFYFIKDYIWP